MHPILGATIFRLGLDGLLTLIKRVRGLNKREKWTVAEIEAHQQNELGSLRRHACANSPFYKRFHQGLENAPLEALPVLTKQELMRSWDEIVTVQSLKLSDVHQFLESVQGLQAYKSNYYAFATGGSTGVIGITVYSRDEFLNLFLLTARVTGWTGMRPSLKERPRMATVQSNYPWHLAGAAGFIKIPLVKLLALDTIEPMPQPVAKLNEFQPHNLAGYASNVHLLAREQIAGRLRSSPQLVLCIARRWPAAAWGMTSLSEHVH